ncbi:ARL14 effector protein [Frankliniella fusca]|uniref:ARL14 effector protein n=1 Tax=Frankliniella fusca TaxID=407009 RepID=A0AAE1HDM5_9NEOP|nr:ARL14 effector protein [Frankliniella fusca]
MCSLEGHFGACNGPDYTKDNFTHEEWYLLKLRSKIHVLEKVCENHRMNYLVFYGSRQKKCCDPFSVKHHKKPVDGTKEISMHMHLKSKPCPLFSTLIPGQKLCKNCFCFISGELAKISSDSSPANSQEQFQTSGDLAARVIEVAGSVGNVIGLPTPSERILDLDHQEPGSSRPLDESIDLFADEEEDGQHKYNTRYKNQEFFKDQSNKYLVEGSGSEDTDGTPGYNASQEALKKLNASLAAIDESPIQKRKLTTQTYVPTKIQKLGDKVETLFKTVGAASSVMTPEKLFQTQTIDALLQKFEVSESRAEKIMVLSIALVSMQQTEVLEIFGPLGATSYMIKKTADLMKLDNQGILPVSLPKKGRRLPEETIKAIQSFYEDDEHASRLMPGKKDYVSVLENGVRIQKQKRLVLCNLKELHVLFEKHTGIKVSFSTFAKHRPKHCVLAGAAGTHTVCVCIYHENFKLMNDTFDMKECDEKFGSYKDVMASVLCDPPTSDCYINACCPKCPGLQPLQEKMLAYLDANFIETLTFDQWTSTDRCNLETLSMKSDDFVETYINKLKILLPHHHIAKEQAAYLKKAKEELKQGEVLVICDFAENYTCLIQDSIQSYYWKQDQVTLHPFCAYYRDEDNELKQVSYTIVSEYMKHSITAVHTFQKKFVEFLRPIAPDLKLIKYFSDGAAQQYKNRFNVIKLDYHEKDFGVLGEWHFFATSHGKGPCDGQAGALKREACKASLQMKKIRNPREFYKWAKARQDTQDGTKVCFVTSQEVLESEAELEPRFARALKISDIRSCHAVIPKVSSEVETKILSSATSGTLAPVELKRKEPLSDDLTPGQCVTVVCGAGWTPALISSVNHTSKKISAVFLKKTRQVPDKFTVPPQNSELKQFHFKEVLTILNSQPEEGLYHISKNNKIRAAWQLQSYQELIKAGGVLNVQPAPQQPASRYLWTDVSVEQYVIVQHEESWIFGQILSLDASCQEILVACSVKTQSKYKFTIPENADQWPFQLRELVLIVQPKRVSELFILSKNDLKSIQEILY